MLGVFLVKIFMKKKLLIGTKRDIFLEHERKEKGISSFEALEIRTHKFYPYQV